MHSHALFEKRRAATTVQPRLRNSPQGQGEREPDRLEPTFEVVLRLAMPNDGKTFRIHLVPIDNLQSKASYGLQKLVTS